MLAFLDKTIRNEDSCYKLFLGLKTTTNILGLMRGTAFGYILHKLNVSPFYLSLFFIISIFSNIICYYLFPFFHKKLKSSFKTIIAFELLSTVFLFCSVIYLFYISNTGGYGSYWIIVCLNLLLCVPVYGFISASPLFVKETFSKLSYRTIIRLDFISFSIAKLIGFSLGVLIINFNYVIGFFILGLIYSICLNFIYFKIGSYYLKNSSSKLLSTEEKTPLNDTYYNQTLTYLILLIPTVFMVVLNVQAVFLDKTYGIPFYLFPLVGAVGGLFFNVVLNKNLSLRIGKQFILLGFIICSCFFILAFSTSKYLIFPAIFLCGGAYTTLSTICTSRLYSYSKSREPKSISTYYISLAGFNVAGTLVIGILFELFSVKIVFSSWSLILFLLFCFIIFINKRFNLDKTH